MLVFPAISFATNPPFKDQPLIHNLFDRDVLEYNAAAFTWSEVSAASAFPESVNRKSPLLAGILSAAIPGAGEVYSGHWIRALVHFGIELTAWGFYFHYDARGDSQTELYKGFAHENWNVVDYAKWLNDYWWDTIPDLENNPRPNRINIDEDVNKNPWERVSWSEIHAIETKIQQFSHRLEPFGTQQYYELIGKYPQYTRGWNDSIPLDDVEQERIEYFDDISDMFTFYSSKRGYANTLYARAHNAAIVVFLNHFISAFHAAYLAHRFNEAHFAVDIENRRDLYGERFVPTMRLQIEF